ncbi:MAG: alpha-2-macroglobulin family protein [bacterium]|nr:alpha-2-macroglobulin family protein [bacterium]
MNETPRGKNPPPLKAPPFKKEELKTVHERNWKVGVGILLVLGIVAVLIFSFGSVKRGTPSSVAEETYTLVHDKVSKSAAVALALPKGVTITPEEAATKVTFEPALEGKWLAGGSPSQLLFEPSKKLTEGNYYTVSLQTTDGTLSKDFLVDGDPAVLAIFPREKSEAPENSDITIVFNRPMIPLTTLDALEERDIPVEITPATKGKFKWISTRNLQFVPETHLVRSANYTVKVKDGFVSMDGLPIKGVTHTFITRPLRFADTTGSSGPEQTIYNQPRLIHFNQPIDLERTKSELILVRNMERMPIPVTVAYGTRMMMDEASGKLKEYTDKSVLAVYQEKDRFGRERFWDFSTDYTLVLKNAYPLEGDIVLKQGQQTTFKVPEVIAGLDAESERSRHVAPDLFDPSGKLWVRFYEDIDKDASTISAPSLRAIEYGEKCKKDSDGNDIYVGNACEKEADKTRISLSFDKDAFVNGQQIPITFKKIENIDGLSLIAEPIVKTITVYPTLSIRKTVPEQGATAAGLTEIKLCSNTPLAVPEDKDFYTKVKSNVTIGKWDWQQPYRVTTPYKDDPCVIGEFENTIRYGLVPEMAYQLDLTLQDDFGQGIQKKITFTSGKIAEMYRRFTHLQKAYNVTAPDRTKLVFGAENLEYANLHICRTDAPTMLRYISGETRPAQTLSGEGLECTEEWSKRIELPKRFWTANFFEVDLKQYILNPLGHYILTFSHPDYRKTIYDYRTGKNTVGERLYERSFLTVTNLAVQEKKIESGDEYVQDVDPLLTTKVQLQSKGNLYWVTKFGTLAAVSGARVDMYKKGGLWVSGGTTDEQGIARTPVADLSTAAIVTSGADSAIVTSETDKFQWAQSLVSAQRTYIYTDRPIYRPTEEVSFKGLYRIGYDGDYEIVRNRKAIIDIYDSRGEKVVTGTEADISENGTFTGKLQLKKDAPLGMYRIEALGGYGYFEVEEYVPAAFKVDVTSGKEEYIAGDKMSLTIDAAYYFGVPLEKGDTVEYSILAQDYYFDRYTDGLPAQAGYFQFGMGWYYLPAQAGGGYGGYGDRFLLRGKTTLNEKGKATIEQPLDFEKLFKTDDQTDITGSKSKIFTVNITVKNKQGQTVSARKSLIVHRGAFYLGANLQERYFGKGAENKILVKSVDTQGKPTAVGGIDATLYKLTWEAYKRQEVDSRFYSQSQQKKEAVKTFNMRTNSSGDAEQAFSVSDAGEYQLEVKATDNEGNPVVSTMDFYVYGAGVVSVKQNNNETLDLAVDRNTLKVGETANVIIKSPFEKGKALVTIERGRIFDYQIVEVNQSLVNIGVPIKAAYLPNVYFSVLLLSPRPDVKYGQIQFNISSAEKELTISVRSDKKNYLPGEKVRLFVESKDSNGKPAPAEVSIAVADMSVLALKGNPKKDPVAFFYAGFPLGVSTASNIKNILYEAEVPIGTKGGGGSDGDLAKKKRGDFRSTAFWQGVVLTDAFGKADVTFTLPDNLTTWQSEVVGITKDTKVGAGYSELVARKEIMLTPLKPRFIVPGDTFKLGAKVFNQSEAAVRFNIKLESSTLEVPGAKNAFVKIEAGESAAVYFDAKAPEGMDEGAHTFTLSAEGGDLLDSVEDRIAITKNDTYESVATAFSTSKERAREYVFLPENVVPDKGALTITANATLAMYLTDAIKYLIAYPYGCGEQIASKLSAIAVIKRAEAAKNNLKAFAATRIEYAGQSYSPDELVEIGLSRIYGNQTTDGGFTYYPGMDSNPYLTLHVLNTLLDLRAAGYTVKQEVIASGAQYVTNKALYDDMYRKDKDMVILTAYALEHVVKATGVWNPLHERVVEIAGTKQFVRETGSNLSLGYLALILSSGNYPASLLKDVMTTLENRLTIDGRGAFMKMGSRVVYDYYETPIKDTALLLKAWSAAKKDHELTDKVLRWLLKSRSKDGSWGSTNNTLSAIEALTNYLEWKKESDSNFELSILMDGAEKSKFTFDKTTNEKTSSLVIPVADIEKAKMHTIDFVKKNLNTLANTFYYDLSLTYFLPINAVPARDEGFAVERNLYTLDDTKFEHPMSEAKVGDVLKGILKITVPKERRFVSVEDFIPAGTELVNFNLSTEDQSLQGSAPSYNSPRGALRARSGLAAAFGLGGTTDLPDEIYSGTLTELEKLHADADEQHDDRLFLFKEHLPEGVYEYTYFVRALVPGVYHHLPAVVSELYFPENFGRTKGEYFTVTQ